MFRAFPTTCRICYPARLTDAEHDTSNTAAVAAHHRKADRAERAQEQEKMSTEIKMPQMGESIAEGTLTRWFKKPGETVKRDEPLFEISTDKVDAEIPSPGDGVLQEIIVTEGTTVEVNTVVALLGSANGAAAPAKEAAPAPKEEAPAAAAPAPAAAPAAAAAAAATPSGANGGEPVRSSPLVRRIARENGVSDLSTVPGSGLGGRVTKKDILAFIENRQAQPGGAPAGVSAVAAPHDPLPVLNLPRDNTKVERLTVMRKKIAEHMLESRRTSAHVHSVFEADMTKCVALREKHKRAFQERHGTKLTYTAFFVKAATQALQEFPYVNASLDGDEIVMHNAVNMGIAVALDGGLIVPVIKNAQELSIVGLQKKVTDLATRSRSKKLVPDEVTGGTFTITNPGQFGGLFGIPIINQPQVAILGLGGIIKRPVVVDGNAIAIRDMVYLCLSYDHRLVDGALADQFMARLKQLLENWDTSVLD
ncbi:MAG: 2-oxoglutarate dehydrogenase, E2 component, dihydrolipoamide succinyltransferase [Planctomycetota bacterium]